MPIQPSKRKFSEFGRPRRPARAVPARGAAGLQEPGGRGVVGRAATELVSASSPEDDEVMNF